MFEQSIVNRKAGLGRRIAILVSVVLEVLLLALALVVPLVLTDILPAAQLSAFFVLPPLPVGARPAQPPPEAAATARRVKVKPVATNQFVAPRAIPKTIEMIVEEIELDPGLAELASNLPFDPANRSTGLPVVSGLEHFTSLAQPAVPPPPVKEAKKQIVRVKRGGEVIEAQVISKPSPAYPPLARQARIQGDVLLNAVIGIDGRIQELRVQSGHPLLVRAAVEAVSQWRYSPTILNGDPVEVITQITVSFKLQR